MTMLRTALSYASDLPRAAARAAVDRGLELLTTALPTRTITSNAGDPYLGRTYLAGRYPKGFEGLRTVLGSLDGTAYLHRFHRADLEPEHHSHPWEWAVSIVLTGGYVEETVLADGTIVSRERPPGSVGVLTAGGFHRVARLRASHVWTLFLTGPRTPDGMWYFRRLDGEIVPYDRFLREREAERADTTTMRVAPCVAVEPGEMVAVNDDGLVEPTRPWWGDTAHLAEVMATEREARGDVVPLTGRDALCGADAAAPIGQPIQDLLSPSASAKALGAPVVHHFPEPGVEKRLSFEDGSTADLLVEEGDPYARAVTVNRRWRHTAGENMAARWAKHDVERFKQTTTPATFTDPTTTLAEDIAAQFETAEARASIDLPVVSVTGAKLTGRYPEPAPPEGYTFDAVSAPSVVIRYGDAYVGSLMTNGRAVSHGRELRPDEIERHAAAWEYARALRSIPARPQTKPEPPRYRDVHGDACVPPFVAQALEIFGVHDDALAAYSELRRGLVESFGRDESGWPAVCVLDSAGRTVVPPTAAALDPHDHRSWDIAKWEAVA